MFMWSWFPILFSCWQDLVCKTFYEFWFEEPSGSQARLFGGSSSVPLEVAKKTEQIVEMLRKMPNHQVLVTVIKRNLALDFFPQSTKAVGINPVSLASVRRRCELMCKFLLERILQVFIFFSAFQIFWCFFPSYLCMGYLLFLRLRKWRMRKLRRVHFRMCFCCMLFV